MSNIITVDKQMEQEFAYVDSIINAHTNSAIAKVNMVKFFETYSTIEFAETVEQLELTEFVQSQTAQIEAHPIVQTPSAQTDSLIVQSGIAQFQPSQVPAILCLIPYTAHIEIINRCKTTCLDILERRPNNTWNYEI